MVIMKAGPYDVTVKGNSITVILNGEHVTSQEISSTYNEHYPTLEAFVAFCGEGFKCDVLPMPQYGFDIIYLYNHSPERPLPKDLWTAKDYKAYEEDNELPDTIGGNFGYAINTLDGYMSEWGYAPFPRYGETHDEHVSAWADGLRAFAEAIGGGDDIAVIDADNFGRAVTLNEYLAEITGEEN